jgi:uncharacterized membrane protein
MVIFTAFTVFSATVYNMEIIGIIGLAGAYAVPFLLSDNSGRVVILFSYMTLINSGILILSFRKNWRILNNIAYYLSWFIFAFWFLTSYRNEKHQTIALAFSFLFFLIFYLSIMAYKTMKKEKFGIYDIFLLLSNAFIYYGFSYHVMEGIAEGEFLGLFTAANAVVHFLFAWMVKKNEQVDLKLFFTLMAMVLAFITIAAPVQMDGDWVTLLWSAEIFLLFWIGRIQQIHFYEFLSLALILPALASLAHDWNHAYASGIYDTIENWRFIFNITFFTSLVFIGSVFGLVYLDRNNHLTNEEYSAFFIYKISKYALPVILFFTVYLAFFNEISNIFYYKIQYTAVAVDTYSTEYDWFSGNTVYDYTLMDFRAVWLFNYSAFFLLLFSFLTLKLWKNNWLRGAAYFFNVIISILFITAGLLSLSELRENYLSAYQSQYFNQTYWSLNIRYISYLFLTLLLFAHFRLARTELFQHLWIKSITPLFLHFIVLVVLSSELTNIMILTHADDATRYELNSHKVGYTVLWGLYSFVLMAFGFFRKQKLTRIAAFVLFGITIFKLFMYDLSNLSTINKVIAFIALGILLLIVSYLYYKFRHHIFSNDEK